MSATLEALWFDGEDARGQRVGVRPDGEQILLLLADGGTVTLATDTLRWAGPSKASRPMLEAHDGRQLVLDSPIPPSALGVPESPPALVERAGASRAAASACVLALAALLAIALAWLIPASVDLGKRFLPWRAESMMGEEVLRYLDRDHAKRSALEPEVRMRLQERFRVLAKAAGIDGVRLEFRSSPRIGPNAFALPGRIVVLTDELVALMGASDRLDAILAHELGHVANRHPLERVIREHGYAIVVATIFQDAGTVRSIARHSPALVLSTVHSREAERESDAFAIGLLQRTGRSGEDFAQAMETMRQHLGSRMDGGIGYLSSHPATQDRIDAARRGRQARYEQGQSGLHREGAKEARPGPEADR